MCSRHLEAERVMRKGGTGGFAIAARLAGNHNVSAALTEADGFYQVDNGEGKLVAIVVSKIEHAY